MAQPKKKLSSVRGASRRSHYHLTAVALTRCAHCGGATLPHTVCAQCGYYKNRLVKKPPADKSAARTT